MRILSDLLKGFKTKSQKDIENIPQRDLSEESASTREVQRRMQYVRTNFVPGAFYISYNGGPRIMRHLEQFRYLLKASSEIIQEELLRLDNAKIIAVETEEVPIGGLKLDDYLEGICNYREFLEDILILSDTSSK